MLLDTKPWELRGKLDWFVISLDRKKGKSIEIIVNKLNSVFKWINLRLLLIQLSLKILDN